MRERWWSRNKFVNDVLIRKWSFYNFYIFKSRHFSAWCGYGMKERDRGRAVKGVTRREDVWCKGGSFRGVRRNGVGVFMYAWFERTTSLSHVESRARTALDAVNSGFLVLGNSVFQMKKQIFWSIDGVESRREISWFQEVWELEWEFAYERKANPLFGRLGTRKSGAKVKRAGNEFFAD